MKFEGYFHCSYERLLVASCHLYEIEVLIHLCLVYIFEGQLLQIVEEVLQFLLSFAIDCFHGLKNVELGGKVVEFEYFLVSDFHQLVQLVELAEPFRHEV